MKTIRFSTGDTTIEVMPLNTGDQEEGLEEVSRGGVGGALLSLDESLSDVRAFAEHVRLALGDLPDQPAETNVEFGVSFNAKAGAVIVSGGVGANLKVSLRWHNKLAKS